MRAIPASCRGCALRSLTTLMNPEITVRLISNGLYLNGVTQQVQQAALAPAPEATPAFNFEPAAFGDLDKPLEPKPTDAETERQWEQMLQDFDRLQAAFDPAPAEYTPDPNAPPEQRNLPE
jgi:hypothetical protein